MHVSHRKVAIELIAPALVAKKVEPANVTPEHVRAQIRKSTQDDARMDWVRKGWPRVLELTDRQLVGFIADVRTLMEGGMPPHRGPQGPQLAQARLVSAPSGKQGNKGTQATKAQKRNGRKGKGAAAEAEATPAPEATPAAADKPKRTRKAKAVAETPAPEAQPAAETVQETAAPAEAVQEEAPAAPKPKRSRKSTSKADLVPNIPAQQQPVPEAPMVEGRTLGEVVDGIMEAKGLSTLEQVAELLEVPVVALNKALAGGDVPANVKEAIERVEGRQTAEAAQG